jgi:hypothetical protein
MLEELRSMYSTSVGRPHTEAAYLAEKTVRDRERANGGGDGRDVNRRSGTLMRESHGSSQHFGHEEDALVRSALDVVAQRYANEGLAAESRCNGFASSAGLQILNSQESSTSHFGTYYRVTAVEPLVWSGL